MWIKFISNKDMLFLFVYKYVESVTYLWYKVIFCEKLNTKVGWDYC